MVIMQNSSQHCSQDWQVWTLRLYYSRCRNFPELLRHEFKLGTFRSGGIDIIVPIAAGISAWLLCVAQNAANVIQAEQSKLNKYGMMAFSVGLSLYLGWFVPAGVALYWIASNLFAILQQYLLNWAINPKDYVDYEELEASKQELEELQSIGGKKKLFEKIPMPRERRKISNVSSL